MLTRLTPVATLIDTKQQSATTSFNQGCSANKKGVETHTKNSHFETASNSF